MFSTPPPPPAIHRPAPQRNQQKTAENYARTKSTVQKLARTPKTERVQGHALNIQVKKRHTNRLKSRKQAKLRAKR
jgi:hypothetical protein